MTRNAGGFGGVVRALRVAHGWTQGELAERSGLSVRTICDIEGGRSTRPYRRSVRLLAEAFKLSGADREKFVSASRGVTVANLTLSGGAAWDDLSLGPVCDLPATVYDFTGRDDEVDWLRNVLAAHAEERAGLPTAVISGQPGVGKTALALQVAHLLRSSFPDGQLWVQLAGASPRPRDPGDVLGELLRSLGVHGSAIPDAEAERAALYRSRLAGRQVLLLADDAASAAQVRPLLPGTAGSAVIVTSRVRLTGLPGARLLSLDPFTAAEATALLTRIVGQERAEAEPEAVLRLAAACGLIPLAVRIAGAKLAARPSWPVSLLMSKIASERRRLDELQAEDLSVRVSFALSYETLHEQARRLFRLLGLLGPNDFAEWVFAALLGQSDASVAVNELIDKSLLSPIGIDPPRQARYRLHDLLWEYARERLADEPAQEREAALCRAVFGWLQLADLADRMLPGDPYYPPSVRSQPQVVVPAAEAEKLVADPIPWFTAERRNLLEVVELASASGKHDLAVQLAARMTGFLHLQSRTDDAMRLWRQIKDVAQRSGDRLAIAEAQLRYAATLVKGGWAADATELFDRCMTEFERTGEETAEAFALYWRGACVHDLGRYDAALRDAERGLALSRRIGNRHTEVLHLRILGQCLAHSGNPEEGVVASERALFIANELGEQSYELAAMHNLAYVCNLAGRYDRAAKLSLELLDLGREIADVTSESISLGLLGDAYHGLGHYSEAVEALEAALSLFREHCNRRRHVALCLLKLGYAYEKLGRPQQACRYLKDSLAIFRELQFPHYEERALHALANCRQASSS